MSWIHYDIDWLENDPWPVNAYVEFSTQYYRYETRVILARRQP